MQNKDKVPYEIPTKETPHNPSPVKDPTGAGRHNPINPKVDEPLGQQKK